MKSIDTPVFFW